MKLAKKLLSILASFVMVFNLVVPAFAAEETGSITINDAVKDHTYTIYQILELESYDNELGAFSYKAAEGWVDFVDGETVKGVYLDIDERGYVTWHYNLTCENTAEDHEHVDDCYTAADAAAFARLAQAYAQAEGVAPAADPVKAESEKVEFTGLPLGYYLVDTTLGALCSLDTTNPSVEMYEKNEVPSISKAVEEDNPLQDETSETETTGPVWTDKNDAAIGDTVKYKVEITAHPGAQNYVFHDKMTAGLTFNPDSVEIAGLKEGTDYNVVTEGLDDGCTFHVVFTKDYLDTIAEATTITVTYSATLNENALISEEANQNNAMLSYGDNSKTEWVTAETFTFKVDIVKTDNLNVLLTGATFELYDAATGGNLIPLVETTVIETPAEGEEAAEPAVRTYRLATAAEAAAEGFESAVIQAGQAVIAGLDGNTDYYLEEVDAPAGYNKLTERVRVTVAADNLLAKLDGENYVEGGVQVINQAGTELPTTGGIGTTLFYIAGGAMVIGAVVAIITRKSMEE